MKLEGKKAFVVGVGPGLGSATTYLLLREGAQVVIAARTADRLERIKVQLGKYGNLDYITGDASSTTGADNLAKAAAAKLGKIDLLILLAGNYADTPIAHISEAEMDSMLDSNVKAPIFVLSRSIPYLSEGSSVVMISSVLGTYGSSSGNVAYSAAKAGIAKATEVLSNELLSKGIRVNAVAPRSMRHDFAPERNWRLLRKLGDPDCPPEDVASVIAWLCSSEASWIDGIVIPVDGGRKK